MLFIRALIDWRQMRHDPPKIRADERAAGLTNQDQIAGDTPRGLFRNFSTANPFVAENPANQADVNALTE